MRFLALIFLIGAFAAGATNTTLHTAVLYSKSIQNPRGMAASGAMHGGFGALFAGFSAWLVNGLGEVPNRQAFDAPPSEGIKMIHAIGVMFGSTSVYCFSQMVTNWVDAMRGAVWNPEDVEPIKTSG